MNSVIIMGQENAIERENVQRKQKISNAENVKIVGKSVGDIRLRVQRIMENAVKDQSA